MVKRLRRSPLTAESGVRFPLRLPCLININSKLDNIKTKKDSRESNPWVRGVPENRKIFGVWFPLRLPQKNQSNTYIGIASLKGIMYGLIILK